MQAAVDQLLEHGVEAVVLIVPHETVLRIAAGRRPRACRPLVVEGDLSRTPLTAGVDNVQGAPAGHPAPARARPRHRRPPRRPAGLERGVARIEGWRAELEAGAAPVPPLRWGGDWSARSGYARRASRWPARRGRHRGLRGQRPDGARRCARRCARQGRRVPDDVSVVGFDDLPEAAYFAPPLTTVRQDFAELGRRAMALRRAGARRRGARRRSTWCRPRSWSARPRRRRRRADPRHASGSDTCGHGLTRAM